jgi:hypothetical protein
MKAGRKLARKAVAALSYMAFGLFRVVLLAAVAGRRAYSSSRRERYFSREERSIDIQQNVLTILNSRNSSRCIEYFRMDSRLFMKLCSILRPDVVVSRKLPLIVQVAIYLDWVANYSTVRKQKHIFLMSHDRIILARRNVQRAILRRLYGTYVTAGSIPDLSTNNKYKYFQGAYGCLDGSHFPIEVNTNNKENWRNRKGFISTNGLLVCGVDNELIFQYSMFGAEGCGSDSTILQHATAMDLNFVGNGFLLGDAGYPLSRRILTPNRGVRYHLKEFHSSALGRPRNKEELFNLRHASMRNQIERAIGVMKKRFRVLREPLVLESIDAMVRTYYACVALHNFIRIENKAVDNNLEIQVRNDEIIATSQNYVTSDIDDAAATGWRNSIALAMWDDYENQRNSNNNNH